MRFVLLIEGDTEKRAAPDFLKRWLDNRLKQRIRIQAVRFHGWTEMANGMSKKALMYLSSPSAGEIIGVIALMDLYGPDFYPTSKNTVQDRVEWATERFERKVNNPGFRIFFAVHELEAWLLSDPSIFPPSMRSTILNLSANPEKVDFDKPPCKRLNEIYRLNTGRRYPKVTHGKELFDRLDPNVAYDKCPHLKRMLDEMLNMARAVGL